MYVYTLIARIPIHISLFTFHTYTHTYIHKHTRVLEHSWLTFVVGVMRMTKSGIEEDSEKHSIKEETGTGGETSIHIECMQQLRARIERMQSLVRAGEFAEAAAIGAGASASPVKALSLAMHVREFSAMEPLAAGAGSARLSAGFFGSQGVVLKRPILRVRDDLERFRKELTTLAACQGHAGVLELIGARLIPPDYFVVTSRCDHSVEHALYERGWRPDVHAAMTLMRGVASALAHVHARGVLHRDLKPANVLLRRVDDGRIEPVIADFGIAEFEHELHDEYASRDAVCGKNGFHKWQMVGTLEYMSPEVLMHEAVHTRASDVYAWSIMMNEVLTGCFPFSDCTTENPKAHTILEMGYGRQELAAAVVSEGLRPILSESTPAAVADILGRGWHAQPHARLSFDEATVRLDAILEDVRRHVPAKQGEGDGSVGSEEGSMARFVHQHSRHDERESAHGTTDADTMVRESDSYLISSWLVEATSAAASSRSGIDFVPEVSSGRFITAGMRGEDKMEDAVIVEENFSFSQTSVSASQLPLHLFGVFDGHRGAQASKFMERRFGSILSDTLVGASSAAGALRAAFDAADVALREELDGEWRDRQARMGVAAAGKRPHPGTTALAALVYGRRLAVANCGDCRALLCRGGQPVQLTTDHTASNSQERERLASLGVAVVDYNGTPRVPPAMIEVTRSVGDFDMKVHGLTSTADVTDIALCAEDDFLVLGSDGLFERITNEEIIALVHDTVKNPGMCCQRLVTEAVTRGTADNVSAVLIFLSGGAGSLERIY